MRNWSVWRGRAGRLGPLYVLSDIRPSSPAGPDTIYQLVPEQQ